MALSDEIDFTVLVNEKEHLVIETLDALRTFPEHSEVCFCEDCVLDMVAFALNRIKPEYRVSLLGSIYARGESLQEENVVKEAVLEAIHIVSSNPAHK